jgi:hypothetical protein
LQTHKPSGRILFNTTGKTKFMNKKSLLHYVAIIVAITLFSCNKADDKRLTLSNGHTAQKDNTSPLLINAITVEHAPCNKIIVLNCVAMNEVIIRPQTIQNLRQIIEDGNTGIGSFFSSENASEITEHIPEEWVTKLASGNYNIAISYEENGKMVLIAGETNHVTFANHEFGIEFSF